MSDLRREAAKYAAQVKTTKIVERVVERFRQARGGPEPMGAWDEKEHYWPDLPDFKQTDGKSDRFGDFYKMTYQFMGHDSGSGFLTLFVDFDATQFVNSEGKEAGKWKATNFASQVLRVADLVRHQEMTAAE